MSLPLDLFLTPEQIRDAVRRVFAAFDDKSIFEEDDDLEGDLRRKPYPLQRRHQRWEAMKSVLRHCVHSAVMRRDAALAGTMIEILDGFERWEDEPSTLQGSAREALAVLLDAGAPVDDAVEAIAGDARPAVRRAVAMGLKPDNPEAEKLLMRLASDVDANVRGEARRALGDRLAIPWWKGKFDSDPILRMTHEEAEARADTLRRLAELLDKEIYEQTKASEELASLAEALPPAVALEALRNVLRAWHPAWKETEPVGAAFLRLPGALDALLPILVEWRDGPNSGIYSERALVAWGARQDPAQRARLCDDAIGWLRAHWPPAPEGERSYDDHTRLQPYRVLATLAASLWTGERDLRALVAEAIDTEDSPRATALQEVLFEILKRGDLDFGPIRERIVEARLADHPDGWSRMWQEIDRIVAALPNAELRPIAERAAASEHDDVATWGWELLADRLHDPSRDGPIERLHERLLDDPRTRELVLKSRELGGVLFGALRRRLRAGELDFALARKAFQAIEECFGGTTGMMGWLSDAFRHREREYKAPPPGLLPEYAGPPTEEEWVIFRRLRDASLLAAAGPDEADQAVHDAVEILPRGPWDPADRPLLDRLIADFRADPDESGARVHLAYVLAAKPSLDSLALLDEVLAKEEKGSFLRKCRQVCAVALGVPGARSVQAADSDEDDGWGDEDEDEEDED